MSPRLVDHHVHLFSEAARQRMEAEVGRALPQLTAAELIPLLDRDGVDRAVVLSVAYCFLRPDGASAPSAEAMAAENDWVAKEVMNHRERLVGFFSINPLCESALGEMDRCARNPAFAGVKLHLANSNVDLRREEHTSALARVLAEASRLEIPIVVHFRTRHPDFGRDDVGTFVERVLPTAPNIAVQVAHAAGWGGYDETTDLVLGAFAEWLTFGPEQSSNLLFDLSAVVRGHSVVGYAQLAQRLRRIGLRRVLFGTDWPDWEPRPYLAELREHLPLSDSELVMIAENRATWVKEPE